MPRRLVTLRLDADPVAHPLTYPGALPGECGLLLGDSFLRLAAAPGGGLGEWLVEPPGERPVPLDALLRARGQATAAGRRPVLAVGSNAAPAQLRRKFAARGVSAVVPMTVADVTGIRPGVSAHVGRAGYVPATAVLAPGGRTELTVCWLDDAQLDAVDATEGAYDRVPLPGDRFPVVLASGERPAVTEAYASTHGCLLLDGVPRALEPQPALLASLLGESARLRELFGGTPEEMVARAAADPAARVAASRLFAAEGWVGTQPFVPVPPDRP